MPRRYRLVTYNEGGRQYIQLVLEYRDHQGVWHTKLVKSYGQITAYMQELANRDLAELQRLASQDTDPIPIGTVDQAVWAGFYRTLENPISELPIIPLEVLRDLGHLGAWIINTAVGSLPSKVSVTQPHMSVQEQAQFVTWLQQRPAMEQAIILAYRWMW